MNNIIGMNIKRIRKEKNLKQSDLAKALDKSTISVRKWESGDRTPKAELLEKIANVLDVSLSDLYENIESDDNSVIFNELLREWDKKINFENISKECKNLEVIEMLLKHYDYVTRYVQVDENKYQIEIESLLSRETKILTELEYKSFSDRLKKFVDFEFYCIKK
ncbi:transcriptional repressor DicA [uncultured Clostridium sp.]|nr:transcriptional repressor DicA [uncultured Clostridium sp.]